MANWEKRRENRETSTRMLEEAQIPFTSHNGGAHLHIIHKGYSINFWPGTGLYRCESPSFFDGRGVRNLLKKIETLQIRPAAVEFDNDHWLAKQRKYNLIGYLEYEKHVNGQ